ncbi:MAG: pilus assembly protein, partial [Deltaproteobacteria bacterium]|nr:pilus assembly protein [Deltaproteobacteria bacterium]
MTQRRRRDFGYSLLEQAAALPLVLVLIFGLIDATSIIQGYNAVRQGVTASLRCLYPTDGECTSASADTRDPLYKVTRITRDSHPFGSEVDYRGNASWFSVNRYIYDSASVSYIGSASFDRPRPQFEARQELTENPTGYVPYAIQLYSSPYVSGTQSNIRFGTRGQNGNRQDYPAEAMRSIAITALANGSTNRVFPTSDVGVRIAQSEEITLPSPFFRATSPKNIYVDNLPCFESSTKDGVEPENSPADFTKRCDTSGANVILWVTGNIGDNRSGAKGAVLMELEMYDEKAKEWRLARQLGGRLLEMKAGSNDDFVPRGMAPKRVRGDLDCASSNIHNDNDPVDLYHRVDPDLIASSPCEPARHHNIRLKWGTRYRLAFRLQSHDGGTVTWKGERAVVALPHYITDEDPVTCFGTLPRSQKLDPSTCSAIHPAGPVRVIDSDSGSYKTQTSAMPCSVDTLVKAQAAITLYENNDSYTVQPLAHGACGYASESIQCPQNYGHPSMPAEPGAEITERSIGQAVCPVPMNEGESDAPRNLRWIVSKKTVQFAPVTWQPPTCQELEPPVSALPQEITRYAHYQLLAPQPASPGELHTLPISPLSPNELKKTSQFSCPQFTTATRVYDSQNREDDTEDRWLA